MTPAKIAQVSGSAIRYALHELAAALPREYLCPDIAKLEALTRATAGDPKIPGWRAFSRAAVRTSRKAGA